MVDRRELEGYKYIEKQGVIAQMRKMIRKQAEQRFGAPTEKQASKLDLIEDLERLERIALAVPTAVGWDALLAVS